MSVAFQPALARAFFVASQARSEAPVPGSTQRRSLIPVRWVIHSSDVSIRVESQSLVTTRSGTWVPIAAKTVRGMAPSSRLDVQVLDVQRVLLDELAAR